MPELALGDAVHDFLSTKKPQTARTYRADLDRMTSHLGPSRSVTDVKPLDLIRYWQTVPPEWVVATRNKHIKTIRTFFNWLVKMDELDKSPAGALKLEPDRKLIPRDKAIADEDVYRLIDYCKWQAPTPRDLALVMFAADTGCRAGELARLAWGDVGLALGEFALELDDLPVGLAVGGGAVAAPALFCLDDAVACQAVGDTHGDNVLSS